MKAKLYPLWVTIDVLILLAALALWVAAPEYRTLNLSVTGFGVTLGILLFIIRMEEILVIVKSSYFRKAAFHTFNVILVLAIFGVLNYLGNRNFREFDITREKRNSLTGQTRKILEMIKSPLKMTVYSKREEWNSILAMLKLYKAESKKIKIEAIDTDLRPDLVKAKDIQQNGTVILTYEGKDSKFVIEDELSVTNALLKMLKSKDIVIYLATGHQELSCSKSDNEGISILCDQIKAQNYQIKDIDLTETKEIPKDATALFIFGPHTAFFKTELEQVDRFIKKGGSVFLSLAPAFKAGLHDDLINLGKPFGLTLGKDIVIDRLSTVQGAEATIPIVSHYDPNHPITAGFNLRTVFPLSASVKTITGKDTAALLALTSSFPGSWAETDLKGVTTGRAEFQEKSDTKGPVGLMGVGEATDNNSTARFVLLGSTSFLLNGYQGQSGNTTLFLNSVSWLVNDEGIISFNRPGTEEEPVILSAQHLQMIFIISILLVPIVFFGSAIFVYRRRRFL